MHVRSSAVVVGLSLMILSGVAWCAEPLATITVEAGPYARVDTPVSVPLAAVPAAAANLPLALQEVRGSHRTTVPAQLEPGPTPRLHWIVAGRLPAGQTRTYKLVLGDAQGDRLVRAVKGARDLELEVGDAKVMRYHHAIMPPPAGKSKLYERSGFIHPLWSPMGAVLTDIHPPDHIHHMGIWMPWAKTEFEGKSVDFWNLDDGQGTVRFVKYLGTTTGPVYGGFRAKQHHVALQTDVGEKLVLDEVWDVRVYNVGEPNAGYWLWDFMSTQRNVADTALHQKKYRYGGFGFRGARQWKEENAAYLTSEGKTRADANGTTARWCDTSGKIENWQGVTFFSHPKNFRHPEAMRIWPPKDKYVFFNFCPSAPEDWEMKPGEDHVFRYRLFVHEGKPDVDTIERIWHDYAEPPQVKVECNRPEQAMVLFDGKDFSHWQKAGEGDIGWKIASDGAMQVVPETGSIMTKRDFTDFMLHAEFRTPQLPPEVKGESRGNSGIYIQRRYELQILDSYGGEPNSNECGGIYKFKAPDRNVCKKPGEWQTYDILFHAARFAGAGEKAVKVQDARITVFHNGVLIHDDVEVTNKTGAGQPEGPKPAPILLQEHDNEMSFRNIWIVPLN